MSSLPPSGHDIDATIAAPDSSATPPRELTVLARGDSVGRYVVLDRIGHGGMGIVYAAYDPELDRRVALKLLAPGRAGHSDGTADRIRLLREAQAMAKLAHAHVVPIHDAGTHEGSVFIAMEFVEGGTLGAKMAERPPWRTLLPLFLQAGSGLAAAHAAGVVHRDFKPDNVLVSKDGVAKVADFGLARTTALETSSETTMRPAEDALSSEITRAGAFVGTPAYMAPEQHLHLTADARSDQFSFCVALYEALYGERPFTGRAIAELAYSVSQGIVAAAPPGASVPARLRKIVTRGLAVDPDARWPGMEELLAALRVDPSRRRTRVLVLGGFAVALLGGAGGLAALDHQEHQRCRAEAATAHERWNDEVRERMTTSMRATDLAFVEPTIERTSATLDAWVRGWSEAREEVCNAATRDADDVVAPLRRACLDERLVHLEVTLELLAEADETTTSTAVQMVAGLPRLESCDDERWLRQRAAMVSGAGTDSGTALGVTRLIALVRARRTEPARALVDELLVATRDIPYLQAEVIHARGDLEEDSNDPGGALKHYEEAYFLAGKHQNDRIAALAAINLTMLVGVRIGDLEKGRSWAAHATMMVERDPDPELRNELLYAVGALETTAENHEVAIALFLEEAALAEQTFGAEHPETGYAHLALGNAYSSAGRTDEARAEFEIARGLWERTYGREHPTTVMVTYNLGNLAVFDGRIADALRLHREALAIRERIRKPGHMELAESYTAIGTLLAIQGDSHGALAEHQRALELKRTHMGADAPRTWLEMDNVIRDLIELDRRAEAEPLVAARCEAAERRRDTDTDGWMRCLGIQGDLLLAADRPRDAAARFEQAVGVADALYGASHLQARTVRQSWAHALMEAGEPARARALLERIVAEWNDTVAASHPDLRGALGLHGQASLELGDRAAAVRSLERALALAEQHGAAKEISLRRRELARARDVGGRP